MRPVLLTSRERPVPNVTKCDPNFGTFGRREVESAARAEPSRSSGAHHTTSSTARLSFEVAGG
eukprot:915237-Prorocentrum_minimum.AAC.1